MALLRLPDRFAAQVFALDTGAPIRARAVLVGLLGMGAPVLAGLLTGRLEAGLTIGLGAILLSGAPTPGADAPRPGGAVAPALLAVIAATLIAGHPATDALTILLAGSAALVSGYSRPLAVAAIRFAIYLVLSAGLLDAAGDHRGGAALIFGVGALWNILLRVLLHDRPDAPPVDRPAREPTPAQRRAHFRRTLRTGAGWQYPARLAGGLTVASLLRHAFPGHHYAWILLTVALLTQRPLEHVPVKILQRLIGTIVGVGIVWAILGGVACWWGLAGFACLFAALVPVARARSYLLYAIVATPLILLVLDLGKPIEPGLLADRIVATLLGGLIAIAANLIADRWLVGAAVATPRRPSPPR